MYECIVRQPFFIELLSNILYMPYGQLDDIVPNKGSRFCAHYRDIEPIDLRFVDEQMTRTFAQ